MIAIIDYGVGNLRSVQKGLEKVGQQASISQDPEELSKADGVVLPGVGAFADAMKSLDQRGLTGVIKEIALSGKPFLGICLGMQLLFEESEEGASIPGLALLKGRVRRLPPGLKVPHMGWNQVEINTPSPILKDIDNYSAFYFVHSYYVDPVETDTVTTWTDYGLKFASVISRQNIFGVQFHPEKSSNLGLQILKNFGELIGNAHPSSN
jgi:glutamine amidotransferase